MVLVQKWQFIELFFLGNIGQENVFYDILERKSDFLRYKKKKFKKSKNWHFYQGVTHGFGPKTDIFPTFFSGNLALGNVLYDIVYRKNAFVAYKKRSLKSQKIDIFPKGLNHAFGQNMATFPTFCLGNIGQENVFYDILERKNGFLGYKNKKFKKSKNCYFSKDVNTWFWSRNEHCSNFLFRQYRAGKCLLRYSRTKTRLSWV